MRNLKAEEIQCRVQIVKENGFSLLLYKDARCDMEILDKTYGEFNWKREHERIGNSLFCTISVWDDKKEQWIPKQDVGSESNMEAEKGQSSDSFKRAGFNWGIGRELYTAPFIWIQAKEGEVYKRKRDNKWTVSNKIHFTVREITTESGVIQNLVIIDQDLNVRYRMGVNTEDEKEWLNESNKERWMKAEAWVKEGNDPSTLRSKYKVSKANMDHFERLYKDAGHG